MTNPNERAPPSTPAAASTAPAPRKRKVVDVAVAAADFLRSAARVDQLPPVEVDVPEIAFLGKSNVGKSSLLNTLVLRKHLVKTSKTPGHTRLLNQFGIEVQLRRARRRVVFVDLPGYGFAQTSKAEHARLGEMLTGYFAARAGLALLVHLFDLRHPPTKQDVEMWDQLSALSLPRVAVGTKSDRVPASKKQAHAKVLAKALGIGTKDVVIFSSESREGRNVLWGRILGDVDADIDTDFDDNDPADVDTSAV